MNTHNESCDETNSDLKSSSLKDLTANNIIAYQEASETIRHYSNASFRVRTIALVQGLVILGAWIYSINLSSIILTSTFCIEKQLLI